MEQSEQTAALYDYLYRDSNRIASYSAQLLGGKSSTLERTDSNRSASDRSAKLNFKVAAGELKSTREVVSSSKEVFDPHDIVTTDVLATLMRQGRVNNNVKDAAHGSMVIAKGVLVFIDRHMLELASTAMQMLGEAEASKPKHLRDTQAIQAAKMIQAFLQGLSLPSAFLLKLDDGTQVAGTIKEAGMEEPISSYYFKHGVEGLSDVHLIAIKEIPSGAFAIPSTNMMGAGQHAAQALSDMIFPKEAIRVTPIALFRKLAMVEKESI